MAEFKLGRIRFVWKNEWTSNTTYYQDDVVYYSGKTYICVLGHTSQTDFFADFDIVPPKWNLMTEGQSWKGEWSVDTYYAYGDIVSYGARLYICNTIHTSAATVDDESDGLEANLSNWTVFAEGLDWKGDWTTSTRYKINDLVKYGGTTYVCNTLHVSAETATLGLENDQSNWDYFNRGLEYKQDWQSDIRYKVNDLVRYGAGVWICVTEHTGSAEFATDSANWERFVDGFQYENDWSPFRGYQPGDIVRYGGNQYLAIDSSTDQVPTQNPLQWEIFTEGFRFIGDWNEDSANQEYKVGEVVRLGGFTYVAIQDNAGQQPPSADHWKRLNEGFRWRGEWLDDQEYFEGDVVRYGTNSYICTAYHISEGDDYSTETLTEPGGGAEGSRPDLADSGQYWSVIAIGTEESVLTTKGDLVYFTGEVPTRLPIGKEGQILQVSTSGIPEWEFLQSVEDVYFVAEHGIDRPFPESGSNIDRPFKTIRYACEQIEKGPKFPNAQYMLELNRVFIQEEVGSWINYQIANAAPGSIYENFEYGEDKCKRDVGIILDKIKWDLGHGGNLKTRSATQSLLGVLGDGPFSDASEQEGSGYYPGLGDEADVSVEAYNYMLTLIDAVLQNEAPDTIYQNVTDDSTAIVEQYTNELLEIEADAYTRLAELVGIVTTAIASQDVADIPDRIVNQTLVKVSTGKHLEVLPIIVPAYCAILGDELRSTQIEAAPGTVPASDNPNTIATFDRISEVVSDIVVGNAVTATTGNNEIQSQDWPLAITEQSDTVSSLVDLMKYQIDYRLNTMHSGYVTDPTNLTTGLENARQNIIANIDFLLAETIAYLDNEYPTLKYGKTDTRRDARYIIDSLIYDLTYGGNSLAVLTGLAYWDGDDDTIDQLPASLKTETIDVINYLKTTAQSVASNTQITSPAQTLVEQTLTGNVGSTPEIANGIEDIIDIIENGPQAIGSTITVTYPTLTDGVNTTTALIDAKADLVDKLSFVNGRTGLPGNGFSAGNVYDVQINPLNKDQVYVATTASQYDNDLIGRLVLLDADGTLADDQPGYTAARCYVIRFDSNNNIYVGDRLLGVQKWNADGTLDTAFNDAMGNTNGSASEECGIGIQSTGKVIFGGDWTTVDGGTSAGYIARVNSDGTLDTTFNSGGVGFDEKVSTIEIVGDDKILVGGWFTTYNGVAVENLVRLNADGSLDTSFTCSTDISISVSSIAVQPDGKILVAGRFGYRRLNSDGTLDSTFPDLFQSGNTPKKVIVIPTGEILLAGSSSTIGGQTGHLHRLNPDGTYNTTDNYVGVGGGTDDVYGVAWSVDYLWVTGYISHELVRFDNGGILKDTIDYISTTYPNLEYNRDKCVRDLIKIHDAVGFDFALNSTYRTLKAAHAYLRETAIEVYTGGQKTATRSAIEYALLDTTDGAIANVNSDATAIARVQSSARIIDAVIFGATNEGSVCQTNDQNAYYAMLQLERNREFIKAEVSAWIADQVANASAGSIWENFTYNSELCLRDVDTYLDALKMDLMYPGNYSSRYVARYYTNAVTGSQEEDMFYLRDATGVRNCTLRGLNGDLLPPNAYGTSRTSAGAYCSLDPGFGPDDFKTWIISRSPYIQGVTTFGYAAIGQKIDGALHNGGNDSMTSNDFTQVISDGIGAWITNNGRAELVSVFTYYSHIGYLAEEGGRIRATNGNNSYGDFGSVAEGVDADEEPTTAIVDNRTQYSATIKETFTDNSQVLQVEYNHAGNDYTEAVFNTFGAGTDAELFGDEFRDDAVNYVLVDQNADPDIPLGGSEYLIASNVAQSGSTTDIFLSATDGNLSSAYPGMKIYIIGGAGIGQFGIIDTYNAGSKQATVLRESDGVAGWDHIIPGTAIVAPNASSTYQIEPAISFPAPPKSSSGITMPTTTTWYDVKFIETAKEYIGVATTGGDGTGATFDVIRNGSKYYLEINAAGTGYTRLDELTIVGTDVDGATTLNDITITVTSVNSVTGAIVDFDFTGIGQKGKFLAVGAGTNGAVSIDGTTWTAETLPSLGSGNWSSIGSGLLDDGSSTFKPGYHVIVADGDSTVAYSTDIDTWSTTSLPGALNASGENTIAFGQIDELTSRFVVISDADTDVAYSDDGGANWTLQSGALPATGFGEMTFGAGKFVAINSGTTSAAYSNNGIVWTGVTAPATFATVTDIVWGRGKFVALGGTNGIMYSFDGTEWFENDLTLPITATERKLSYGQGVFVISSDDTNEVQYSEDGIYWQSYTLSTTITGGYNAIAFGNPNREGKFVALLNAAGTAGVEFKIGATAKGRPSVANEQIFEIRITEPGSGYDTAPAVTVTDPNNIDDVDLVAQLGKGSLSQPTFINRGQNYTTVTVELDSQDSNGNADFPQTGTFIAVRRLTRRPVNGSNVEFNSLSGEFYKLVNVISFIGTNDGSYTAFLQLSPGITVEDILPDGDPVEMRIRFSQVRLTGHDFLDIGTGNFTKTNYPGTPTVVPDQNKETSDFNGGRVFFTSTDQDGNFRVGDLFSIEQATGVATLNAEAFNIAGLQELQLGEVTLGGNSASVTEFSTDPFFTANSDNIVPTQRAIKAYIESQIGGGGATLNVNSVTAGDIFIGTDTITTVSGDPINIKANVVFSGTVLGLPLAYNLFLR